MYPLVNVYIAIENGHRNSEFPPLNMVIFHSYVAVYQAGYINITNQCNG